MGNNPKSIAKNTILLYVRLVITVFIAFFTQRIVLKALGVDDYGLYNVVGGIIVVIGILNAGMVQASQRFFAFEIGKKCNSNLKPVFGTSLTIHSLLALFILIVAELVGIWFLNSNLNIAPDRLVAANIVYQATIMSFLVTVVTVPFDAMIISKEDFNIYAYISICEYVLKLIIAYIVLSIDKYDNLIIYAWLLFIVTIISRIICIIYCKKKYEECVLQFNTNIEDFKRLFSFAGYSLIGNIGFAMRNQGVNFVINIFCGTAINAARGIAYQVSTQISAFASNFQMAAVPQITKSCASEEYNRMLSLIFKSSKYSFCLLFVFALPILLNPHFLLELWLDDVPKYADNFLTLALIASIIDSMAIPIGKGIDATGKIKNFQILICILMCLDIPLAYIILKMHYICYSVMYVTIVTSTIGLFLRLILLKKRIKEMKILLYLKNILLPCILTFVISYLLIKYIVLIDINDLMSYLIYLFLSFCICIISVYLICINSQERKIIIVLIKNRLCRITSHIS